MNNVTLTTYTTGSLGHGPQIVLIVMITGTFLLKKGYVYKQL